MILTVQALSVVYPCKLVFPDGTGIDYPHGFDFLVLRDEDDKEVLLPSGLELELDDSIPIPTQYPRVWVSPLAYERKLIPIRKVPHGQAADEGRLPQDVSPPHDDGGGTAGEVSQAKANTRKSAGHRVGKT